MLALQRLRLPMDTVTLSPTIRSLLDRPDLPELASPRGRDEALLGRIQSATPESLVAPQRLRDAPSGQLLRAGLLLWQDFLDAAHEIAQEVETKDGSYWHGFMHRRQPDAGNARYWFRQVGSHAIFPDLYRAARAIAPEMIKGQHWNPFTFIDLCEKTRENRDQRIDAICRKIQKAEFDLLLEHTYRKAVGADPPSGK